MVKAPFSRGSWGARFFAVAWALVLLASLASSIAKRSIGQERVAAGSGQLDPTAWGDDHVGEPLPEFVESGECLFCHRREVGSSWARNRHQRTIRDATPAEPALAALRKDRSAASLADEVELILGDRRANRFLKRSAQYGKLDMLSVVAHSRRGRRFRVRQVPDDDKPPRWLGVEHFAQNCAGCHATGVDPQTAAFALPSLDCFVCHGDSPLEHANDSREMILSRARHDPPRVVISICAQCHLRGGRSKATGRPYPTNFVPGDNLFRDFVFDFSLADSPDVNPGDRHVIDNVRQVVLNGRQDMTCLSCHDVHRQDTRRHRKLKEERYCGHCHAPGKPLREPIRYEVHSPVCQY